MTKAEQRSPFGPAPLQSLRPYYGLLRPCAPHRYSDPRGLSRLQSLPLHRGTGSHVPYKSLVELRAAYMPDAARAGSLNLTRRDILPTLTATLTTIALDDSSLQRFEART